MTHPQRANWLRSGLLFGALLTLEAAPVEVWLVVYAATERGAVGLTAASFWLLAAVLALFAATRWRLGKYGPAVMTLAAVVSSLVAIAAFTITSPLAQSDIAASPALSNVWLENLVSGLAGGGPILSDVLGFMFLTIYLGWRGMLLGRSWPPYSSVSVRLKVGLGAVILGVFGSLAAARASANVTSGALFALLILEGFAGLCALSLSHTSESSSRSRVMTPGAMFATRWQLTAVALALGVTGFVALVSGLTNLSAISSLLASLTPALMPVAAALNSLIMWLAQSIAYVLYLIFVVWISQLIPKNLKSTQPHLPHVAPLTDKHHYSGGIPGPYLGAGLAALGVLTAIIIIVAMYFVVRTMLRSLEKPVDGDTDEEREPLDVSGLLKEQARDWLNRWRGARNRQAAHDELRRGSARWLFRELLRAGERHGHSRRSSETPSEYVTRLAGALTATKSEYSGVDLTSEDLRAIAAEYGRARYGGVDADAPGSDGMVIQTQRVTRQIDSLGATTTPRR